MDAFSLHSCLALVKPRRKEGRRKSTQCATAQSAAGQVQGWRLRSVRTSVMRNRSAKLSQRTPPKYLLSTVVLLKYISTFCDLPPSGRRSLSPLSLMWAGFSHPLLSNRRQKGETGNFPVGKPGTHCKRSRSASPVKCHIDITYTLIWWNESSSPWGCSS